jgi:ribose 5-phosphate isomerase B
MKKILIGSDHAGFELKAELVEFLQSKGFNIEDVGCFNTESCDYPHIANVVASFVNENPTDNIGILICGTGIGMTMAANRYKNVRAALVNSVYMAEMSRKHGDCNVISLGARTNTLTEAKVFLEVFLTTPFEGGRHARRIEKLSHIGE